MEPIFQNDDKRKQLLKGGLSTSKKLMHMESQEVIVICMGMKEVVMEVVRPIGKLK